ncbi:uncharacterized protein LOC144138810 [Haemaphysalis longicornis]
MSSTSALTFTAFWTPDSAQDCDGYVKRCVEFFQSAEPDARVDVSNPTQLWNGSYGDHIYQALVTLRLNRRILLSKLEAPYVSLVRRWCASGRLEDGPRFLQWLTPDRKDGFVRGSDTFERNIQLASVGFGAWVGLTTFAQCLAVDAGYHGVGYTLSCVFKHDVRALTIFLTLQHAYPCGKAESTYKLDIPYQNIVRAVVDDDESEASTTDIYLHLSTFPLLYKQVEMRESNGQGEIANKNVGKSSTRQNPEFLLYERALELGCPCIGVTEGCRLGVNFVLALNLPNKFKARQILGRLSRRCDAAFVYTSVSVYDVSWKLQAVRTWFESMLVPQVAYGCTYALCALIYQSNDLAAQLALLSKPGLLESFTALLPDLAQQNDAALERALFAVSADIEARSIVSIPRAVQEAFLSPTLNSGPLEVPPGSCLVRRIFLLPSRLLLLPPCVHHENRVLRNFKPELALRLTIRDDNLQPLSHSLTFHSNQDRVMDAVVGSPLREGIWIGNRQFRILASSSSQLRDHGVWLYAVGQDLDCPEGIRQWMGDFSGAGNIAKRMARMGLCFSSTEASVQVPLGVGAITEPDIVGGCHPASGRPYVFSDGIGMISSSLLHKVCEKLEIRGEPSAVQVRYAGYKGMLCLNPDLAGDKLVLRESMRKFPCHTSEVLEVIKVSTPRTVCLNRPLIILLEQLGVPGDVFVHLQQSMVLELAEAMVCERAALRVLTSYVEKAPAFGFAELQRRGLSLTRHPFVRLLLSTVYRNAMDGLRSKSRIAVPPSAGRNMLGVLDETRTLHYGQVFVQYTELGAEDRPTRVRTGTVLVTKCPCLHPGDVRLFEAVDVPGLHHIKDCIVFPATGPRPHPNEMAGSDLDGDEYAVIWHEELFFPPPNRPPMVFVDHSAAEGHVDGNVEEAMIQFICDYIKNDAIGVMASAHLAWADQLRDGVFSQCCVRLAAKISVCLDFAKTGTPARLDSREKPRFFPDFMEKGSHKNTYRSRRILGQLYRLHRSLEALVSTDFGGHFADGDWQTALFEFAGWEEHREAAEEALQYYASQVGRILNQYGMESEGEVVTGLVNKLSDVNKSYKDRASVETLVSKQYQHLVKAVRKRFFSSVDAACQGKSVTTDDGRKVVLLQMMSAWYMVAYESRTCGQQQSLSFPWAMADVLLVLAKTRSRGPDILRSPRNLLVSKIDDALARGMEGVSIEDKAFHVITKWAIKDELLSKSKPLFICKNCLKKLFQLFVENNQNGKEPVSKNGGLESVGGDGDKNAEPRGDIDNNVESGADRDGNVEPGVDVDKNIEPGGRGNNNVESGANGDGNFESSSTVGELVVGFLRHVCSPAAEFPPCGQCRWSPTMTRTVTMAALRTYSLVAITRDLCHVGLPCEPRLHKPVQLVQEGNPVRIQVGHPDFVALLQQSPEEVERLLCDWTGVQEVHVRGDPSPRSRHLMVSAVGRDWQRWFLEELVLQPWLEEALLRRDLGPFLGD